MEIKKSNLNLLKFLKQKNALKATAIDEIEAILHDNKEKNIRDVLIKGGFLDGERLAELESEYYHIPYVNLSEMKVSQELLRELPFDISSKHYSVCFGKEDRVIKIALANMGDYDAREVIDFWASSKGLDVHFHLCSYTAWENLIRTYGAFKEEFAEAITEAEGEKEDLEGDVSTENIEEVVKSAPVAKIVSMIVKYAVENKASDIHIEPFQNISRVRYRIDGILNTVLTLPNSIHDAIISRIKVLSNLKIDETRVPQDGRFKFKTDTVDYDVRVSIMPLNQREKATLRILDTSGSALTLEQLGFSQDIRDTIAEALKQTYGMILVTGPTGSGKSTTLFSLMSSMNKEGINICTLEDPIEYYAAGVNQAQIRPEIKFTFASGLRSLLRQDPDIIMVGEIRDNETAEMAVHAALTGHLLFSTLHTNDSIGAIPRLIDMKVEPFLMASTINLILAQRLARRVCSKCKEQYQIPLDVSEKIRKELAKIPAEKIPKDIDLTGQLVGYRGKGCSACKDTGYSGRVVLSEALPINESMRSVIANGFKMDEVKKELQKIGMISLLQDGIIKALNGITTLEEVFRVSKEVEEQE